MRRQKTNKMKQINNPEYVGTYELTKEETGGHEGFCIDIFKVKEEYALYYEAWLYHKAIGTKVSTDASPISEGNPITLEDYLAFIQEHAADYVIPYIDHIAPILK